MSDLRHLRHDEKIEITPQNYGFNNINTIYHYTDYMVASQLRNVAPHRYSGWFVFTLNGTQFRCTASLISRSILVTAGHCVHQGGGGGSGFITGGTYYPAYRDGASSTYGQASANYVVTTGGWANTGSLDAGYDVALVVLNKKKGTAAEIGTATGWYGFCWSSCLQNYWYNTQLGYPGNYYSGTKMTQGEHLERSDGRDYVYGSGMEGGSSGGPHVANIGILSDSSNKGQWTSRNVVFATTSWGYTDNRLKMQGASALSGPNNSNNFVAMWNLACNRARTLHGAASCNLL
jgi:V8-like Glu-specific endopeptidase